MSRRPVTRAATATPVAVTGEGGAPPEAPHEHAQNTEALERAGHIVEQIVSPPQLFRHVATHHDHRLDPHAASTPSARSLARCATCRKDPSPPAPRAVAPRPPPEDALGRAPWPVHADSDSTSCRTRSGDDRDHFCDRSDACGMSLSVCTKGGRPVRAMPTTGAAQAAPTVRRSARHGEFGHHRTVIRTRHAVPGHRHGGQTFTTEDMADLNHRR